MNKLLSLGASVLALLSSFVVMPPATAATLLPGAGNAVMFNFDFTSGLAFGLSGPCGSGTPCPVGPPPYSTVTLDVQSSNGQSVAGNIGMMLFDGLNGTNYLGTFASVRSGLPASIGADGIFSVALYAVDAPVTYDSVLAVGFKTSIPSAFLYGVVATPVPEPASGLLCVAGLAGVLGLARRRRSAGRRRPGLPIR